MPSFRAERTSIVRARRAVRRGACVALAWIALCSAVGAAQPERGAFPGVIELAVDGTDVDKRIIRVRETVPVAGGRLTLLYPQWVPGHHGPAGSITLLAGLTITAGGKTLPWMRDATNMHAFHVDVPEGVTSVDLSFQYLSPLEDSQGRIVVTQHILAFQWHSAVLYPAGHATDDIRVRASIALPAGWQHASSLEVEGRNGDVRSFRTTSLTELVDSPVWAGRHHARAELVGGAAPVALEVFADLPESLKIEPRHTAALSAVVDETYRVFGAPPYRRFDFLVALSSGVSRIGLEHQGSTEIATHPDFFTRWNMLPFTRPVFPHEFVHAWNGKRHRPADLTTRSFNEPMGGSLLWTYEGQTEFWTYVLAARSGLLSREQSLQAIARTAAFLAQRSGRVWRNLQDTNNDPVMRNVRRRDWSSWQRGVDYYGEGLFLWLEADTTIRRLTQGARSMDDFARTFFSRPGPGPVVTYTFEDIVTALDAIAPHDWRSFLRDRLDSTTRDTATEALKSAGWRLVFREKASAYGQAVERETNETDFFYTLGLVMGRQDKILSVQWESPAYQAGLAGGATLVAVNGRAYRAQLLRNAISEAKQSQKPIELLIRSDDWYRTVQVSYFDGLRYPHLEPLPGAADVLSNILTPLGKRDTPKKGD
jgi:predicted metalloprotease with PDZ domain